MSRIETIGDATLYLGDCRDILPTLGKVDAVVTDPPYGMNYRSGHNKSRTGVGASLVRKDGNFQPIIGDQEPFDPALFLSVGAPALMWGASHYSHLLPPKGRWLIWDKLAGKTPLPSGSDVEIAWCSEPGPDRIFTHLWRGIMRAGEENVANSPKQHPNQKPVALMTWCLSFVPGGRTCDPFMGSGTTGVACARTGRPFVGIEHDAAYFDIACRRIADAYKQPRLFDDAPSHSVQEGLFSDFEAGR